jgi:hypothetical protein
MTAQTARLLVDGNGQIIPNQYYDSTTDSYVVGSAPNGTPFSYSTATITSRSGTIATGATAQSLMVANADRKGWFIQNNSTGDLWVNRFGGTAIAGQPSLLIPAGALYETPDGGSGGNALSIYGATTGQTFTAAEW